MRVKRWDWWLGNNPPETSSITWVIERNAHAAGVPLCYLKAKRHAQGTIMYARPQSLIRITCRIRKIRNKLRPNNIIALAGCSAASSGTFPPIEPKVT